MHIGAFTALVFALSIGVPEVANAAAAAPSEATRNEARERFDQGLRLFNEGNNAGALAEFKRAHELVPNPVVTFNIGLVYAAMGRPVEAVDALEPVVLPSSGLSDSDRLRAAEVLKEQSRRVAELVLEGAAKGATVEVDGIEVGRLPLTRKLRVTVGSHVIAIVAEGYHPLKREVTVAGGESRKLEVNLTAITRKNAWLAVETQLPAAEVVVDGVVVGKTPTTNTLTVTPGKHRVELRRPGYRIAAVDTEVPEEGKNVLRLDPEIDENQLASGGAGTLRISVSETEPILAVDGRKLTGSLNQIRLPAGPHVLVTQRAGFIDHREVVDVAASSTVDVHVELQPTPETRESYVARSHRQRNWGWVAVGAGAGIAAGSGLFLNNNAGKIKDADQAYADVLYASEEHSGRPCDVFNPDIDRNQCEYELSSRYDATQKWRNYRTGGWIGVGVGGALLVTGVILLLTNDDASKYDRPVASQVQRVTLRPTAAFDARYQWLGIEGRF